MREMSEKTNKGNQNGSKYVGEKFEISIGNFICDEYSICREERQYAVFLYNILRKYSTLISREKKADKTISKVRKIFEACRLEDANIDHVFYEPTFMRDFYERNRRLRYSKTEDWESKLLNKSFTANKDATEEYYKIESFNKELIRYVYKQMCEKHTKDEKIEIGDFEKECNLGQNEIEFEKIKIGGKELGDLEKERIQYKIKWMMNAQPDIAVIYHKGEDNTPKLLLFIECKFLSKESSYPAPAYYTNGEQKNVKQRQVQWMIADFLCDYLDKTEKIKRSPVMKNKKSRLVQFVRKGETKIAEKVQNGEKEEREEIGEILIEDLIEIDREIFTQNKDDIKF